MLLKQLVLVAAVTDAFSRGLLGRFRGKRTVAQPPEITIGSRLPVVDVEEVIEPIDPDALPESVPVSTEELFGTGTTVLFGLPGAFTPTCSDVHLPGYVKLASKLKGLGVDTIACMSENDRFVLSAWNQTVAKCSGPNTYVRLLADADGDLAKQIGLRDDMGFGIGERCKRFALVLENGIVSYVATDPGMDVCDQTSAESIVEFLGGSLEEQSSAPNPALVGAVLALGAAGAFYVTQGGGGTSPADIFSF